MRPIASNGYWKFECENTVGIEEQFVATEMKPAYPNPAAYITCIPIECGNGFSGKLSITDITGRTIEIIHEGDFAAGENNYFFNAHAYASGLYIIKLESADIIQQQKIIIRNF